MCQCLDLADQYECGNIAFVAIHESWCGSSPKSGWCQPLFHVCASVHIPEKSLPVILLTVSDQKSHK